MCIKDSDYIQITMCPHGALHLRVSNTTLVLTERQMQDLYGELRQYLLTQQSSLAHNSKNHTSIQNNNNLN